MICDSNQVTASGQRGQVQGEVPLTTEVAGIGDFNADGRAAVLWRHASGQLEIWFAGKQGNSALVTWNNLTDEYGCPRVQDPVSWWWKVKGVADFNGDGYSDIHYRALPVIEYLGTLCREEGWHTVIHRTNRCDLSLFQLGLRFLAHLLNEELQIPVAFHVLI